MAIIKCRECSKDISDKLANCPYCGIKTKNDFASIRELERINDKSEALTDICQSVLVERPVKKNRNKWILLLIPILILVSVVFFFYLNRGNYVQRVIAEQEILYLSIGDKSEVSYSVYPKYTDSEIKYYSDDSDIVVVDDDGNVEAVGEGSTCITILAPNGEKDKVEVCVTELYSDWSFFCTLSLSEQQWGFASDFENIGIDIPEIRFWEDRFELTFMEDSYPGVWTRKHSGNSDDLTFNLVLDEGGTITATIIDLDGKSTLVIALSTNDSINFQKG